MARVEVAGDQLTVQIEGMDKLWTFQSRLEIPLAHVTDAEADPEAVSYTHLTLPTIYSV